jgi:LPXTG-motif cell wall-anchored protein
MFGTRRTREFLLVLACCFALVTIPLSAGAQDNILEKGAHGVKKGVEKGAEKTKEGAEAVGHGVKKAVTGEDTSQEKRPEGTYTTQEPSKPTTAPSKTAPSKSTTGTMPATGESKTGTTTEKHAAKGTKELPSTAGELPWLALIGTLALAASGTLKLVRRKN